MVFEFFKNSKSRKLLEFIGRQKNKKTRSSNFSQKLLEFSKIIIIFTILIFFS